MEKKEHFMLHKFVNTITKYRARHTELVSVYIPANYDIIKIIQHLQQEQSTAQNIKSSITRKNVIDALEKMIRHLRTFSKLPKHGLAVFSGNISSQEGKSDVKVWSIEPVYPLKTRIYRCDQIFLVEPLKEMLEIKANYGLILLDRREANIAILRGKEIIILSKHTSAVPGKYKAGGQSAARFARLREEQAKEFYVRVGQSCNEKFLNVKDIKGILLGGPGPTKYEFFDGKFLNNEVKKKILGIKDLGYTGEFGLQELIEKSQDLLIEEEVAEEKSIVQTFFNTLAKSPEKALYKKEDVERALNLGAVDTLLLSENLGDSYIEEMIKKSEEYGTKLFIISILTREGEQLSKLSGIAAILRYNI